MLYSKNVLPIVTAIQALTSAEFKELQVALLPLAAAWDDAASVRFKRGDEVEWKVGRQRDVYVGRVAKVGPSRITVNVLTVNGQDASPFPWAIPPQGLKLKVHTKGEAEAEARAFDTSGT